MTVYLYRTRRLHRCRHGYVGTSTCRARRKTTDQSGFVVHLGNLTSSIFPPDWGHTEHAVFTLRLLSYMLGLWLWGLSVWFSLVSVGSLWKFLLPYHRPKLPFHMTWFSFVFPNTALVGFLPVSQR